MIHLDKDISSFCPFHLDRDLQSWYKRKLSYPPRTHPEDPTTVVSQAR